MDKKYMHASFKMAEEFFCRTFSYQNNNTIRSSYKYNANVPYLHNRLVADDDNVYDYSSLLNCDDLTIMQQPDFVKSYDMQKLNVQTFDEIIRNNIAVAGHMFELQKQLEMIDILSSL